jgi:hypothetical protein
MKSLQQLLKLLSVKALTRTRLFLALGLAASLIACKPFQPWTGRCPEIDPPCSQRQHSLFLFNGTWAGQYSESNSVDSLQFSINLFSLSSTATALAKTSKTTLSCIGCEYSFEPDSVYFTTAIVTQSGDTLPARYNFVTEAKPVGIKFFNSGWIGVDSIQGFRDSVFEVHFIGMVEGIPKSASMSLRITNPALLIP